MFVPMELLKKYVDINVNEEEFVRDFSLKSAEVDTFKSYLDIKGLVIGKIVAIKDHPDSNHLHITTVDFKDYKEDIVCGAPNVEVGKKVIVAKVGTVLPGGEIKKAVIRGVPSCGMNCSLEELGIDSKFQGYDGIYYLDDDAPVGEDPCEYMHLKDKVLEIELTPNRQDLLSVIGVAYDTKAMLNTKMHFEDTTYSYSDDEADITVSTETPLCHAYYSNVIKDVEIKESPQWLKGALMKMDIRPINNVVDITNYVLMVTGHPLHAFDYDYIKSKKIVVKNAKDGDLFVTLDNQERVLKDTDIVITDGDEALCLGGVMGGLNSEVRPNTKNIFLECANFDSEAIKNTSKRLGLQSESSLRYEKGINPDLTKYALDLATKMLVELANGKVSKNPSSFDNEDYSVRTVKVSLDQINDNLGRFYSASEIEKVFSG
nr:phenylalanine--tRNA ligase subunit beta [Gammaproteobacteria bacterium]